METSPNLNIPQEEVEAAISAAEEASRVIEVSGYKLAGASAMTWLYVQLGWQGIEIESIVKDVLMCIAAQISCAHISDLDSWDWILPDSYPHIIRLDQKELVVARLS